MAEDAQREQDKPNPQWQPYVNPVAKLLEAIVRSRGQKPRR